jgi:hypothetical protein
MAVRITDITIVLTFSRRLDRLMCADGRMKPLSVLDLRDLEHAESVRARDSSTLADLLSDWQDSDYENVSLSDWLLARDSGSPEDRPASLQTALDESFQMIIGRLRETGDPDDSNHANNG